MIGTLREAFPSRVKVLHGVPHTDGLTLRQFPQSAHAGDRRGTDPAHDRPQPGPRRHALRPRGAASGLVPRRHDLHRLPRRDAEPPHQPRCSRPTRPPCRPAQPGRPRSSRIRLRSDSLVDSKIRSWVCARMPSWRRAMRSWPLSSTSPPPSPANRPAPTRHPAAGRGTRDDGLDSRLRAAGPPDAHARRLRTAHAGGQARRGAARSPDAPGHARWRSPVDRRGRAARRGRSDRAPADRRARRNRDAGAQQRPPLLRCIRRDGAGSRPLRVGNRQRRARRAARSCPSAPAPSSASCRAPSSP